MAVPLLPVLTILLLIGTAFFLFPLLFRFTLQTIGSHVRSRTLSRRQILRARANADAKSASSSASSAHTSIDSEWQKIENENNGNNNNTTTRSNADRDWDGVIGFFHPFCNAGGGGERVLWAAIKATQERWPNALCVVYTGDHDADKDGMLERVKIRFNIPLYAPRLTFLYLSTRRYVLASTWPHFTLLGQSLGSLLLAYDAFNLLVPDIFVDTMGYAFALALCKLLFPDVPTAAYVHYPTISTDMLGTLDDEVAGRGANAGLGRGWKGQLKRRYWHLFAYLYSRVGGSIDVVMTNSSWTQGHIRSLWGPFRRRLGEKDDIAVVFPPVAVAELEEAIPVDQQSEKERGPYCVYIAQFRPEKDHTLILTAFAEYFTSLPSPPSSSSNNSSRPATTPRLVLIGSVRDDSDEKRVYKLRLLARELHIQDAVDFVINASWPQILAWLRKASVGVNGMWNEHFGIGVVEYQAAGLVSVINDSGGPKCDIVVPVDGEPTGFHASTASEYARGFAKALNLPPDEALAMRRRARKSAKRFSEDVFAKAWIGQMEKLVRLRTKSQL
ncbi:asparagine-linked glycosylation protein [Elasticomyces elasticus]|nr:asparagine-linked glycosylation protein [Elasticomyces elasticus]